MTATTYANFADNLSALAISGVKQVYPYPPASLSTADLPAQWVQRVRGTEGPMTFKANGGWPRFAAQLVVAVIPVAQGTRKENYEAMRAMLDTVSQALRGAVRTFARGPVTWEIGEMIVTVADIEYYAVSVEVSTSG